MSNQQSTDADGRLMDALRALGQRLDPAPDRVTADATAARSGRTLDKELAALTYDSLLAGPPGAATPQGPRHLIFVGDTLCVELYVGEHGLGGRLVPAVPADIEVRWPGGSTTTVADERGGLAVPTIPTGPVSLRCQRGPAAAASPVVTDWVTLT